MNRLFIIILACLALASLALADYHYASHEGSNEYPYTSWETATDSIQLAVEAASAYDTVFIGSGEYDQLIRVPVEIHHLGLIGMGIDSTYIWTDAPPGTHLSFVADSNYISDIHFEHRGLNSCIRAIPGFDIDILVKDCLFTGTGSTSNGIMNIRNGSIYVENCIFDSMDGAVDNITASLPAYVIIKNCLANNVHDAFDLVGSKVVLANNIGIHNDTYFVRYGGMDTLILTNNVSYDATFSFVTHFAPDSNVINNNASIGARDAAFVINAAGSGSMYNNSITSEAKGINLYYTSPDNYYDLRYNNLDNARGNILFDNGIPGITDTSIIYHEFPMYVDPGNHDYHLQAYSPLIDAGAPWILDVDGSRSDIGLYGGPGGESYEYQDLAPLIPIGITYEVSTDSITFIWTKNEEADFNRYLIFRDTVSGFEPSVFNLIAEPPTVYYADTGFIRQQSNYYRFGAVDNQDNQSGYTDEIEVIPTGIDDSWGADIPQITTISNNYPNPFNSSTTIVYHVANLGPIPAQIDIEIYDVLGRKVRLLLSERIDPGTYRVTWDGRNDQGKEAPSGVYFAKISQWGLSAMNKPKKIVLIK